MVCAASLAGATLQLIVRVPDADFPSRDREGADPPPPKVELRRSTSHLFLGTRATTGEARRLQPISSAVAALPIMTPVVRIWRVKSGENSKKTDNSVAMGLGSHINKVWPIRVISPILLMAVT